MKKVMLSILLLISLIFTISAQVGITLSYANADAQYWDYAFQQKIEKDRKLFINGARVGINSWFRLEKVRIEFLPSLEYAVYETSPNLINVLGSPNVEDRSLSYRLSSWGTFLHTRFYLFDFNNDCNCPTFSKQNQTFKKGFFVSLSPGVERLSSSVTNTVGNATNESIGAEWKFTGGIGAGLDLGVSDFLTITPLFGANYTQNMSGGHLFDNPDSDEPVTDLFQYYLGVNIGLRFNK